MGVSRRYSERVELAESRRGAAPIRQRPCIRARPWTVEFVRPRRRVPTSEGRRQRVSVKWKLGVNKPRHPRESSTYAARPRAAVYQLAHHAHAASKKLVGFNFTLSQGGRTRWRIDFLSYFLPRSEQRLIREYETTLTGNMVRCGGTLFHWLPT